MYFRGMTSSALSTATRCTIIPAYMHVALLGNVFGYRAIVSGNK